MSAAPALRTLSERLALIGSPNTGKTTLFNALTGSAARVGNYAGVTVERREGTLVGATRDIRILDLPGTYSLAGETPDELVVARVLEGRIPGEAIPDGLVVVADATTLQRGLGLVREVLRLGFPTLMVVTMIDEAKARGGCPDLIALSRILGIRVAGVVGHRGVGVEQLRTLLQPPETWPAAARLPPADTPEERFAWVDDTCRAIGAGRLAPDTRTDHIDRVLLHPLAGVAVFAARDAPALPEHLRVGGAGDGRASTAAFRALARWSHAWLPAGWLTDLWADGILAGVGAVLIFLPQILILFTLPPPAERRRLHGARGVRRRPRDGPRGPRRDAASCRCSPATPAPCPASWPRARSPRRASASLTILVAPFMTCSARLPVYTLLIAAFVPADGACSAPLGAQGLVLFGLYLLGACTALASAALLELDPAPRHAVGLLHGAAALSLADRAPAAAPGLGQRARRSSGARARSSWPSRSCCGCLLNVPRTPPHVPGRTPAEQTQANLQSSVAARIGHAHRAGRSRRSASTGRSASGCSASLAAREVIVSTLAQIYAVGDTGTLRGLRTAHPQRRGPGDRPARLHAAAPPCRSGLLRLRTAVHVDHRGDGAGDRRAGAGPPSPSATCSAWPGWRASPPSRSAAPCCRLDARS